MSEKFNRDDYTRTTCACDECREPCKRQPGPLVPGDFDRIRDHLKLTTSQALPLFWASPGAVVASALTGEKRMIGTITPRMRAGRCIFLDEHERCSIHAVAPFGCAYVDTHMAREQWHPRVVAAYVAIERSVEYQLLRSVLPSATSWQPVKPKEG